MKVLALLSNYPVNDRSVHGIFHRTQLEALARRGVEVDAVAPVPWVPPVVASLNPRWQRYLETPRFRVSGQVRVHRPRYLGAPRGNFWAAPHRAYARAARHCVASRPDLVHAQVAYPPGAAGVTLARVLGVPLLLTLHGGDVNVFPFVNALCRRRFVRSVMLADSVVAVSAALADRTEALTGRRPAVMPVGIHLKPYRDLPSKGAARATLGIPVDRKFVLYVGNLFEAKGVRELLAALEGLDGVLGGFVGDGPLLQSVETSRVGKAFGMQTNEQVRLYLAAADALVLPSYSEGMPTVLIEAGAARVPVVATRVGGIPELLGTDRGVLVEPKSVDTLRDGIRFVLEHTEQAAQRAMRLRSFIEAEYDVDENAGKLQRLYEELVGRGASSARAAG